MPDAKDIIAGSSSLVLGCDSYTTPAELGDKEYCFGQNVTCRGGIVQTRPGSISRLCAPPGNFQGFTLFTPDNGVAHLVFGVDGSVYVSAAPFTSYRRLWTLQFSTTAKYMAWAVCLKSTEYTNDGTLYSLDNPYSVLVMQDGLTRAAYWDGSTAAHMNPGSPAYPDQTDVVPGYNETPIGLWMLWIGNRLWVSRGNQIFASDIGNPLKFTEALYLNEGRAFYLSGPCTGMVATPDQQGMVAFTENDGTFFQSYIQERSAWISTPDFQKVILPNVGCTAPRSLITQYGLNWWFSSRGLTNFNASLRNNITSRIDYQDNEMFSSKAYLGPDLSGICGCFYENYLMMSVPSADVLNRHTWVLDQAPFEDSAPAWTGIWTGWRPIEWARGIINGDERVFFGSIDYDGNNRIWEAMQPEKTDNGCAITCYAQLRDHAAGSLFQKQYDWSKFFLSQIYGDVDLNVYVASTKGSYQLQKSFHIVATEGQIFSDVQYSEAGPLMIGNRVQSRTIRTPSGPVDNECNSCGVESKEGNMIDYAFSHLLVWSGQMGIRAYQMWMRESPERNDGDCEEAEVGPRTLNAAGCSGLGLLIDTQPFTQYTAYSEGRGATDIGGGIFARRTAISPISQENAQALADCAIQLVLNRLNGASIPAGVYETEEAEIGSNTYVVVEGPAVPTPQDCSIEITVQPESQDIADGGDVSFLVEVTNSDPGSVTTYQWQISTDGGVVWSDIVNGGIYSGATTATLLITGVDLTMDGYQYRGVVSCEACDRTSDPAILSVTDVPSIEVQYLIAGAAGRGGNGYGGGGSGAQVREGTTNLVIGSPYSIVVGATSYTGPTGGTSSFSGISSLGGANGGGYVNPPNYLGNGQNGWNGGGGGAGDTFGTILGIAGVGSSGRNGGVGIIPGGDNMALGGGAGEGGNGGNWTFDGTYWHGGDGASGVLSSISGTAEWYGAGGGGGAVHPLGGPATFGIGGNAGTSGEGGSGASGEALPGNGAANHGSGGGGAKHNQTGGDGGAGVVFVRYAGAQIYTGGIVTTVGGDTVHEFIASGTLVPI